MPSIEEQQRAQRETAQRDEAIQHQQEVAANLIAEQHAVRDELTKDAAEKRHAQYMAWVQEQAQQPNQGGTALQGQQPNQIVSAVGLPPAVAPEPLHLDKPATKQDIDRGNQVLNVYQDSQSMAETRGGWLTDEQALDAEKSFRERQCRLADQIVHSSEPMRERVKLLKAAEYHSHKAAQWNQITNMASVVGYPEDNIRESRGKADHHEQQAALMANKLYEFDQKMGLLPHEVEARMGHAAQQPQIQHNNQDQKALASDPHVTALVSAQERDANKPLEAKTAETESGNELNPAAMRARERRMEILRKYAGEKTSPYVKAQLKEARERQQKIDMTMEQTAQVQHANINHREQDEQAIQSR